MQLSDLINDFTEIASLPEVYSRIDSSVNDPKSSLADIAGIVCEDPGVTSRLLKLANSSFYGAPKSVDTISQAVSLLGTQQVKDLALATSVVGLFKGIPEEVISMSDFWTHSIATAMICRSLARARRQSNVEKFFVAGMLHDIGRIIMIKALPQEMRRIIESSAKKPNLLFKAEREQFDFDHSMVGRALLEAWQIPGNLAEAVEYHHNPKLAVKYPLETAIVHVADIIAHGMNYGGVKKHFIPPLYPQAWRELDITVPELTPIMDQVHAEVAQVVSILLQD